MGATGQLFTRCRLCGHTNGNTGRCTKCKGIPIVVYRNIYTDGFQDWEPEIDSEKEVLIKGIWMSVESYERLVKDTK